MSRDNMRLLLIGKSGQLGWELQCALAPLSEVVCVDYPVIDLANKDSIRECICSVKPHLIVNAAAYTDVDKAESEVEKVIAVNGIAPGIMAEEARSIGAALIHYSTDYVFDGEKDSPYTEQDTPNPINQYSRSKLLGEQTVQQAGGAFLILRTSWMYSLRAENFVTRVLDWARQKEILSIVDDQIGSPTWARVLAAATASVICSGKDDIVGYMNEYGGVYNLACAGSTSRLEWAQRITEWDPHREKQTVKQILPAKSSSFPSPAIRPANSSLDSGLFQRTFGIQMPAWEEMLRLALGERN